MSTATPSLAPRNALGRLAWARKALGNMPAKLAIAGGALGGLVGVLGCALAGLGTSRLAGALELLMLGATLLVAFIPPPADEADLA